MSDNIRIKATPGDNKFLKVNINQKFDFIEILSLKISQDDAYRRFCSDYGVVVGRVIINNGVGVPNAKVSIFIPVDEEDKLDPEIFGLYPFETVTDKDLDGIPYNLLPNNSKGKDKCFTTVGTFPSKREIQDNDSLSKIYCKYYKFTTTTNDSGDYMLFGLPVGTHFLHAEVDISDIGFLSQKPYELITQGGNSTSFKSASKYKNREESTSLSQIKKFSPISVSVQPFWGDLEQCEVGITRNDIDLQFSINPSALFMGSIFTDSGEKKVTKTCLPRPNLGKHDQLSTGSGTVEMIRKLRDGSIERLDVNGGQVIDDDGAWAYLVPMNLDYVTTSEEGDLVPTDDPKKGIPTRARVRFRIKIRANKGAYLIPNNPDNKASTDYSFDQNTRDRSFTDLYWNEIYSVKNYIPRIQQTIADDFTREFTAIKDVDSGSALEFPFNKINTQPNPLFNIICTFLNIFVTLLILINGILITTLNFVIAILNGILQIICEITAVIGDLFCFGNNTCRCNTCLQKDRCFQLGSCTAACQCGLIPYIPYITVDCNGVDYAIGAVPNTPGITATAYALIEKDQFGADGCITLFNNNPVNPGFRYPGDGLDGGDQPDAGWLDCQAILLAETLNVITFDFYNDWVNGTLYAFQFDVSNDGKRFCDTDNSFDAFGPIAPPTYIKDTCSIAPPLSTTKNVFCDANIGASICGSNTPTDEGLIRSIDDFFYYAPISNNGNKFFTTDIINLGSMVDCNWRGTPKIYPYLIDTTFKLPSITAEYFNDELIETGYDTNLGGLLNQNNTSTQGAYLVADIGCFPVAYIFTNIGSCINIRRFCELGVGLDERRGPIAPNNRIDNNDVEQTYVRGVFAYLNGNTQIEEIKLDLPDDFGQDNDEPYDEFRNFEQINDLGERDNSFYFYFGLAKGKTSYDKILTNFFPECQPELETDLILLGEATQDDDSGPNPTGEIQIEIVNGEQPYEINWIGPGGYTNNNISYNQDTQTLDNLFVGTYDVTVVDSLNRIATKSIYVPGPIPVSCSLQNNPISTPNSSDGEIIVRIFNGTPNYTIELFIQGNTTPYVSPVTLTPPPSNNNIDYTFSNLPANSYTVIVTDSLGTTCTRNVEINDLPPLQITLTTTDVRCFGENNGTASLSIGSGNAPFVIEWFDSNGNTISSNNTFLPGLQQGSYSVTVTDSNGNGNTQNLVFSIDEPDDITYNRIIKNVGCKGANDGEIVYTNINSENDVEISYQDASGNQITQVVNGTNGSYSLTNLQPQLYSITLKDTVTGCERLNNVIISEPDNPLAVSINQTSSSNTTERYRATATGGWGDTPVGNPGPGNTYDFEWEIIGTINGNSITPINTSSNTTIQIPNQFGQNINVTIINLNNFSDFTLNWPTFTGTANLDIRCRIRGINGNTGAFCERWTPSQNIIIP